MTQKKRMYLCSVAIAFAAIIWAATWMARGMSDFDLSEQTQRLVSFEVEGAVLSGTLVTPNNVTAPPIAIIIHGDGAQDRFSNSGYLPLINTLVDAGIGVFSWDKAGVGDSTGNWLHQTMDDRADEAIAAANAIATLDDVDPNRIGFLGFSQAGWVLPRVANRTTPAFTIIVGGAVSWRDQGTYYSRIEMVSQGITSDLIESRLLDRTLNYDAVFASASDPSLEPEMDPDRLRFVAGAYWEDSTDLIAGMKGPILAVWGADDLNVDAKADSATYRQQLIPLTDARQVLVIPDATHGLLRANLFNYQLVDDWPWYHQYLFIGMGRAAYAENAIAQIADWIHELDDG